MYTAGSALRWLTEIGVLPAPADLDAVAGSVPDSGGVTFVPALGVAALARLAQGESGSPPAEVELTVHPVMSRDEAAERLSRYSHCLTSALS